MLYCASNISLAVLETFVHLKAGGLPLNRYLVELAIPEAVWKRATSLTPAPVGWDAIPTGKVSLDEGDKWLKANSSALLAPNKTLGSLVLAKPVMISALCGVNTRQAARTIMPRPASREVTFLAQRPRA